MTASMTDEENQTLVRILHLEDSAIDADLICEYIHRSGAQCDVDRVWSREDFTQRLIDHTYDLILADHLLPAFDGESALRIACELAPETPFIFVSGTLGEDVAVAAMKRGATDYVVKQRLDRLPGVIERALAERAEKVRAEALLKVSEARYRALFDAIPQGFCVLEMVYDGVGQPIDYVFVEVNAAFERQTGLQDASGRPVSSIVPNNERSWLIIYDEILRTGFPQRFEGAVADLDRYYSVYAFRIEADGGPKVAVLFEDIKARVDQENRLRESEALYRFLDEIGSATRGLSEADAVLAVTTRLVGEHFALSNCAYADMDVDEDGFNIRGDWIAPGSPSIVGRYTIADFGSKAVQELHAGRVLVVNDTQNDLPPEEARSFLAIGSAAIICAPVIKDGKLVALMAMHDKVARQWSGHEIVALREVTERSWIHIQRVRAEADLRDANANLEQRIAEGTRALLVAEEALRQSQKMEAIGQLTGGLAHDFNNMLAAVGGGLELVDRRVKQGRYGEVDQYMTLAKQGVGRASALTQRLLAFARRQTLAPVTVNVDDLIAGMQDMIDRALGPSIELTMHRTEDLGATMVDAPQLENALLNLCINARDAMPEGGKLIIETANLSLDAAMAAQRDIKPGRYISLSVTDTGMGMPEDVVGRVFEPFYTTKPLGQGTGLGLSMVYGFIRQSGGQIRIHSQVGHGTTVTLYLPRAEAKATASEPDVSRAISEDGAGEVILLVEDEEPIRNMVCDVLEEAGYRVINAKDGRSGVEQLQSLPSVDLLITDVGLPGGLNGRQVADIGRGRWPGLKTLFITGYAANASVGAGHLEAGMAVLTKPFNLDDMVHRVREILDENG